MNKTMESIHKPTQRVIEVLKLIADHPNEMILSNISKEISVPKSTLSPIIKTLVDSKFIVQNKATLTYDIGIASFTIGSKYLTSMSWIDITKNYMKVIVNECHEICQLGVLDNDQVSYIAKVNSEQDVQLMSTIGKTLPLYCTALGRIFLSYKKDEEIRTLYKDGLKSYNENTTTDIDELIKIVNDVRANGFATEYGETSADVQCISVPLFFDDNVIAAISVSLPIFRATDKKLENILQTLQKYSKEISKNLKNYQ